MATGSLKSSENRHFSHSRFCGLREVYEVIGLCMMHAIEKLEFSPGNILVRLG
jgi:hypothetical protein